MRRSARRFTRRSALVRIGASGLVLAAPPVVALERPTIASASRGTVSVCDNTHVVTSAIAGRLSEPSDFAAESACQMTPDTVEGPYFICDGVSARDVTGGKPGVPLTVAIRVVDQTCTAVPGAIVDAWHCDARGWYSGHNVDPDGGTITPRARRGMTRPPDTAERFLRGVLATDADGIAEFDMIYPGYYGARAIHTHYKVHVGTRAFLTSQALYPERINERVMQSAPYNTPRPGRRALNARDARVIVNQGLFDVVERGGRLLALVTLTVRV